jgi:hypothetical protein
VVLVIVVEGRRLEQVLEAEVVVAVVLVMVVEDRKLELAVEVVVVVAQVAVRILFSGDRTVVSGQVVHIAT